jgi:DNA-binding GntR family transcriptional regulator
VATTTNGRPKVRTVTDAAASGPEVSPITLELPTYKRAVYERLRDMIAAFELAPGDRLVETDLAGRLGVSKTPVREAISLLEADGLVEAFPYRGAIVRWLSVNEMTEQGYLLDALEMPAYPIVVERITDTELGDIGKIARQLKRARRVRDERRFSELAVAIHERLFACTGFPRLQYLIGIVLGPVGQRYDHVLTYPFDDAWDVLADLAVERVEFVRRRDVDGVRQLVRTHRMQLEEMAHRRMELPEVARYFEGG